MNEIEMVFKMFFLMSWVEIQVWHFLSGVKKTVFRRVESLHHLSSQMWIKEQDIQEVSQMQDLRERFFFLHGIINWRCAEDKGTLIPQAVKMLYFKTKRSKIFV